MPEALMPETIRLLEKAGWHDKRTVDTEYYRKHLANYGVALNPIAETFLRQFGGLELHRPDNPDFPRVSLDPFAAMRFFDRECLAALVKLTGEAVCPVGVAPDYQIFVGTSGRTTFLNKEWLLMLVCDNPDTALNAIAVPSKDFYKIVPIEESSQPPEVRDDSRLSRFRFDGPR